MQEVHGPFNIPLADAPADDCLLRPGHADENLLIALGVDLIALHVLLLLADEVPQLVKLKALRSHADLDAVVQFHAAHTYQHAGPG